MTLQELIDAYCEKYGGFAMAYWQMSDDELKGLLEKSLHDGVKLPEPEYEPGCDY